jgi:hypothetical protein
VGTAQIKHTSKVLKWLPIKAIHPSPENDQIYGPGDPNDPAMSGHRRFCAAKIAGVKELECIVDPTVKHGGPEFIQELVRYNNQRVKTNAIFIRDPNSQDLLSQNISFETTLFCMLTRIPIA